MTDYLSLLSEITDGEHHQTVPAFIIHSSLVTKKALDIAKKYLQKNPEAELDLRLLEEICMLHDVGIFSTDTPPLFTNGELPYLSHLTMGHQLLAQKGLLEHASAARNHTPIWKEEILSKALPLPPEDHVPTNEMEEILFLADSHYSKKFSELFSERTLEQMRDYLQQFPKKLAEFDRLWEKYCA